MTVSNWKLPCLLLRYKKEKGSFGTGFVNCREREIKQKKSIYLTNHLCHIIVFICFQLQELKLLTVSFRNQYTFSLGRKIATKSAGEIETTEFFFTKPKESTGK